MKKSFKKFSALLFASSLIFLTACNLSGNGSVIDNSNSGSPDASSTTKNQSGDGSLIDATDANVTTVEFKTFTNRKPLGKISLKAQDPENKKGLSTEEKEHSFGVAKDGKPHSISIENQEYFDNSGFNAIAYDNKSKQKVLYLTFDCGWENGYTSKVLDVLKKEKVRAVFFCTLDHLKAEPELIARMINEGHVVGNHSASHANFSKISRQQMADEIAECDNYLRENFGYTSKLFRFPEGAYSECALELVSSLGYKSVFWSLSYADWDVNQQKGKDYAFEKVTSRLHPGAIILLHSVSPDNAEAMEDIIRYAKNQGYTFKLITQK